ncbi:MAG: carbohydrate deacetylase [Mycoplasmatales bacterium]
MRKLIVNCDDFGISRGCNYGIQDLYRAGVLTSTTMLVNGPEIDHAVEISKQNPELGVGLHMCLTMFKPCTNLDIICDKNGEMNRKVEFYDGLVIDTDLIYNEWKAQIERFIFLMGKKPTHLDSHHHIHEIEYIRPVAIKLANEYDLPIRSLECNKGRVAFSMGFYGENCNFDAFKREISLLLNDKTADAYEFSCHVGYVDETIKKVTSYSTNRCLELENLLDSQVLEYINDHNFKLCRYDQI